MVMRHPLVSRLREFCSSRRLQTPPLPMKRRPAPSRARWHHAPRKVAVAAAIGAASTYAIAFAKYGEVEPFTGRTRLALLSHDEARERDEEKFRSFKQANDHLLLRADDEDVIRLRRIALHMVRAAHHGQAIQDAGGVPCWPRRLVRNRGLQWLERLPWEVVLIRCDSSNTGVFPGAGKIVVHTGLLHLFKNDSEIAALLAHEIGHVLARDSSGVLCFEDQILDRVPLLLPFVMALRRRYEVHADKIGMFLLAAAGVHPMVDVLVEKKGGSRITQDSRFLQRIVATHPSSQYRCRLLLQPNAMGQALDLYGAKRKAYCIRLGT